MRQFYLFKNKSGYYNVVFIDPVSGLKGATKSTHCKDKVEATVIAADWVKNGRPEARSNSRKFLSPESSSSKNLKGIIDGLTESDVRALALMLSDKLGSAAVVASAPLSTSVQTVAPVSVEKPAPKKSDIKLAEFLINFWDYDKSEALQRSFAKGKKLSRMHTDAMKGLAKNHWLPYFGPDKLVEDLEQDELDDFFFYLYTVKGLSGSTVNHAITCGSKAIGYLFDKRKISFNPMAGAERYGISNEKRDMPVTRELLLQLMNRARRNPNYSDLSYVFFSNVKPEIPCRPAYYQDSFYEALSEIGISEEQRKERNIVFHSLRHFCATLLAQRTDIKNVQAILGHKSASMSLHYADHETMTQLNNMRSIMQDAWKECIISA